MRHTAPERAPTQASRETDRRDAGVVDPRARAVSFVAALVVQGALLAGLIGGLAGRVAVAPPAATVAAYNVPTPTPSATPPPPPSPQPSPSRAPDQAPARAAPPAPRAVPAPIAVPSPRITVRDPLPAPDRPGSGTRAAAGAAQAGDGSGAGGSGDGLGGGGAGSGGGGGGGAVARRAEKISGEIRAKDFPRSGADERDGRSTIVRYRVGTDGRASQCEVTQSSGSPEADALTCRLIEKRFRYRPAQDAAGRPVPEIAGWRQWWWR